MVSRFSAVAVAVLVAGSAACATKNFVKNNVKDVNDKVDSMGRSIEETQERTRGTKARSATSRRRRRREGRPARRAATQAAAGRAHEWREGRRLRQGLQRLVYTVVLSEDEGQFKSGKPCCRTKRKSSSTSWSPSSRRSERRVFEIEGHTDALGPKVVNEQIGSIAPRP